MSSSNISPSFYDARSDVSAIEVSARELHPAGTSHLSCSLSHACASMRTSACVLHACREQCLRLTERRLHRAVLAYGLLTNGVGFIRLVPSEELFSTLQAA